MKQVIIMSGVSGSGKSTSAAKLASKLGDVLIVSADNFFNTDEGYMFDPSKLPQAHQDCFRRYLNALGWDDTGVSIPYNTIVVDNTNLSAWEISPYLQAGETSGYKVKIVRVNADEKLAWERNVHNVPGSVYNRQLLSFRKKNIMPWWNVVDIESGEDIPLG